MIIVDPLPPRPAGERTLRVATWNVERPHEQGRKNGVIREKLRELDADLLVLTETHAAIVPDHLEAHAATENNTANDWRYLNSAHRAGEHCAMIWSRWPIVATHTTFDRTHAVCAEIATPLGHVLVYGTIITWHADKGVDGRSRGWQEHYRSLEQHGADWQRLAAIGPLITAGDFNTTLDGTYYGTKHGRELLRAALASANLWCPTARLQRTIDHICVPERWAGDVRQCFTWEAYLPEGGPVSDHHGVGIDLGLGADA